MRYLCDVSKTNKRNDMKAKRQILTACAVACALLCSSCGGTKPAPEPKPDKKPFVLKDNTHLYLNVNENNSMKAETETPEGVLLSPRNIVKYSSRITSTTAEGYTGHLAIDDDQRDLEHNRIKMYAGMIIGPVPHMIDGKRTDVYELLDGFIKARDIRLEVGRTSDITTDDGVLIPANTDVVAYIPNAKMEQAEKEIRKAWEAKDNEAVYKFFNDAYTFTPITQKAWDELKAKGEL